MVWIRMSLFPLFFLFHRRRKEGKKERKKTMIHSQLHCGLSSCYVIPQPTWTKIPWYTHSPKNTYCLAPLPSLTVAVHLFAFATPLLFLF